jgi:hypothetical protein
MKAMGVLAAAVVAVLAAPVTTAAQQEGIRGQWNVTFAGGAAVPAGGEFHEGGSGSVLGLPTVVEAKDYGDVFGSGFGWRGGVGYGVSRNVELFGDFSWARSTASELSVGTVASLDLRAAFGEYTSYGLDAGVRYHVAPGAPVSPYVSALVGFRRVDAIPGTFSVPAAGVTLPDTPFFDESTVPVFGGDVGALFAVGPRVGLGVEIGVRYHTDLSQVEGLAGTGLENLNDAGSNWSVPISGVFRFAF